MSMPNQPYAVLRVSGPNSVSHGGGGGVGTRPWWLALLACGGAYWPLAFEPSAMTSRHPYYSTTVLRGGEGGWHKALVVGSVGLWRRLLASRL